MNVTPTDLAATESLLNSTISRKKPRPSNVFPNRVPRRSRLYSRAKQFPRPERFRYGWTFYFYYQRNSCHAAKAIRL